MTHSRQSTAIVVQPGAGETVSLLGDRYTFKATGAETGGAFTCFEAQVMPGCGPPPHFHRLEAESFYVLQGEVTFLADGKELVARSGTFLHLPVGSIHAFRNNTSQPARMLVLTSPAGFEQFLRAVGTPMPDPAAQPPAPTPADIDAVLVAAPKFGIEILPPGGA